RSSWLSKLFGRGPRKPIRRAPQRPLGLEYLEDRVVPTNMIDVQSTSGAALRFLAKTDFTEDSTGTVFSVGTEGDPVEVGFVPGDGETFQPLLMFTVQTDPKEKIEGFVSIQRSKNSFEVGGAAEMDMVVVGGSPGAPIPIWQQTDVGDDQVFD